MSDGLCKDDGPIWGHWPLREYSIDGAGVCGGQVLEHVMRTSLRLTSCRRSARRSVEDLDVLESLRIPPVQDRTLRFWREYRSGDIE